MRHSDAEFSLGAAIAGAQLAGPGVFVAMNGRLSSPADPVKNRASGVFEINGS
jgi:L-asparaginase